MSKSRSEFDTPWKSILHIYFEQFIAYCWPQRHAEIDWQQGYKSLDKELHKISRKAPRGNRIADKVIEVYLKNGQEAYVLLHIEVQGKPDSSFEDRMFTSRYRLRDLHRKQIASVAILIDKNVKWRPTSYREELWDSWIEMKFPIIKLIDYRKRIQELETSSNPFAVVILAQLAVLEKESPDAKLLSKLKLIKMLYGRGWERQDILNLLTFIDWVFVLPEEYEVKCKKEIDILEEEIRMNYVTSWERMGIQKGEKMGFEKGERMGIQKGESALLLHQLQYKFKVIPENYHKQILQANDETLKKWGTRVLVCNELEEVFN